LCHDNVFIAGCETMLDVKPKTLMSELTCG